MQGQVRRREGHRDKKSFSRQRRCRWNNVGLFLADRKERETSKLFGCYPTSAGQEAIQGREQSHQLYL